VRIIRILSLSLLLFLLGWHQEVLAADLSNGSKIFEAHCAGCHANGGNIIRRGKNLQLKALIKYKMDSIATISNLVINGKGVMSAFGDRLTPEEIADVAEYVLERAANNWKGIN
jgi:cytochrome c6